jgi:hypothetical protein
MKMERTDEEWPQRESALIMTPQRFTDGPEALDRVRRLIRRELEEVEDR